MPLFFHVSKRHTNYLDMALDKPYKHDQQSFSAPLRCGRRRRRRPTSCDSPPSWSPQLPRRASAPRRRRQTWTSRPRRWASSSSPASRVRARTSSCEPPRLGKPWKHRSLMPESNGSASLPRHPLAGHEGRSAHCFKPIHLHRCHSSTCQPGHNNAVSSSLRPGRRN